MRVKAITVSYMSMLYLFQGHAMSEVVSNLPKDARVVAVYDMPDRHCLRVHIESKEFPELLELMAIPEFDLKWTKHRSELDALLELIK